MKYKSNVVLFRFCVGFDIFCSFDRNAKMNENKLGYELQKTMGYEADSLAIGLHARGRQQHIFLHTSPKDTLQYRRLSAGSAAAADGENLPTTRAASSFAFTDARRRRTAPPTRSEGYLLIF